MKSLPRVAAPLLAGALSCLALFGCRTLRPVPTEAASFRPMYERSEVRTEIQRARRVVERAEGVEGAMARAALELWEALEALYAAPPDGPDAARELEAALVRGYLRQVEAAARQVAASDPDDSGTEAPPATVVEISFQNFFEALTRAEREGRYADAITVGETLLTELEGRADGVLLAAELRARLGLWQLAVGDDVGARQNFARAQREGQRAAAATELAGTMLEQLDLLQTLPAGAAREDLLRGWALLELGEMEQAVALARIVHGRANEPVVQREATFLETTAQRARVVWIDDQERRAHEDLRDGPPFDVARGCAETLKDRPEPAPARARNILADIQEAEAALAALMDETLVQQWEEASQAALELAAAERLREAAAVYERFHGTDFEERAAGERTRTLDILVRGDRKRAGDLFVAAQNEGDPGRRQALLEEARSVLQGILDEFPDSSYADRVRKNLVAVDAALGADPG